MFLVALTACAADDITLSPDTSASQQAASNTQATTQVTDRRMLTCSLEQEAFSPTFVTRLTGFFDTQFGVVETSGMTISDPQGYKMVVSVNPTPATNLSFIIQLFDVGNRQVAYIVLPRPHVGEQFLFELGGRITPVTLGTAGGGVATFDYLRGYCSIRNPA